MDIDLRTPEGRAEARRLGIPGVPDDAVAPEEEAPAVGEKAFMWKVINYAVAQGWRYFHCYMPQFSPEGWPDLLLLRKDRQVVLELKKSAKEKPTKAQEQWLADFKQVPGCTALCVRPCDWPLLEKLLA